MNRDEIVQIAWDVGLFMRSHKFQDEPTKLEQFAERIAAAEREACAKVCEAEQFELTQDVAGKNGLQHFDAGCRSCAEMIRARGEK